jgi:hypothetical protein|tara:strand:+ start:769 stop:1041 length:273 start_codon:yes stop_codon:yes gene_type:complete
MDKEILFKTELAELMEKHNAELEMNIEDDYAGVQSAKLVFHLRDEEDRYTSSDNELHTFNGLNTEIEPKDVRNCTIKKEKVEDLGSSYFM